MHNNKLDISLFSSLPLLNPLKDHEVWP